MSVSTPSAMGSACRIACRRPRGKEETAGAGLGGGAGNCNRGREAGNAPDEWEEGQENDPQSCGAVELALWCS